MITFVAASVCTLRRAFNRDVDDYGMMDGDDEDEDIDLLAFEDLYVTQADEFGTATHKPVKAFSYSVNDDDDSTISFNRRRTDRTEAATPLIGDVALALPDDGTGRFRSSGPYIRRRANPPEEHASRSLQRRLGARRIDRAQSLAKHTKQRCNLLD